MVSKNEVTQKNELEIAMLLSALKKRKAQKKARKHMYMYSYEYCYDEQHRITWWQRFKKWLYNVFKG